MPGRLVKKHLPASAQPVSEHHSAAQNRACGPKWLLYMFITYWLQVLAKQSLVCSLLGELVKPVLSCTGLLLSFRLAVIATQVCWDEARWKMNNNPLIFTAGHVKQLCSPQQYLLRCSESAKQPLSTDNKSCKYIVRLPLATDMHTLFILVTMIQLLAFY